MIPHFGRQGITQEEGIGEDTGNINIKDQIPAAAGGI
jgi:hypothetical protein